MPAGGGGVSVQPLLSSDPQILGRHRVLGRLGSGGMGVVYLADGPLGWVAVKLIRAELADDAEFRVRFQREVQACFRVRGAHTAELVDFELDAERPWLATEFVDSPDLATRVDADGPFAADEQVRLAVGLAQALASIHAAGLVHRDLKPSNVLWTTNGAKVIDFRDRDRDRGPAADRHRRADRHPGLALAGAGGRRIGHLRHRRVRVGRVGRLFRHR